MLPKDLKESMYMYHMYKYVCFLILDIYIYINICPFNMCIHIFMP